MSTRILLWTAVIGLVGACLLWWVPRVEQRIEDRANTRLESLGVADVRVDMDGRNAVLIGTVQSRNDEVRLRREVEAVPGVRRVTSTLAVRDRQGGIFTQARTAAPSGGAAPVPAKGAPSQRPALNTPEARSLTDALTELVEAEGIEFAVNRADLVEAGLETVDQVADRLHRAPTLVVEVGGHTDDRGTEAFNLDLSRRRAQTVVAALEARGVSSRRLVAQGFGSSIPKFPNRSDEARFRNRRIEFRVIGETE